MSDTDRELSLQDEDRLPWLEAVDSDDDEEGISSNKLIGFVVAALMALGLVVGGVWWLRGQQNPSGDGTLIAAQEGDYKVKPDEVGGMKVEGQGDAAFAASEGAEANATLDSNAMPEAPVAGTKAVVAPVKPAAVVAGKSATTAVTTGGRLVAAPPGVAAKPLAAPVAPALAGSGLVQLGAYGSEASANQAWAALSGRYSVLAKLPKAVTTAAVGGSTFYRLRAQAGAQASSVCATLKAGGASCLVVK
ncbi:MAG: SPOR domain-containing protein [Chakrabartia sp.]